MKVEFIKGVIGQDSIFEEKKPWYVFVGRSNVGKSSLLNAVFQRKNLAYTSKTPGKTTEMNFYNLEDKVFVIDTPGYGFAKMSLKDRQKLRDRLLWFLIEAQAPVFKRVFVLMDSKVGPTSLDIDLIDILLAENNDFNIILTKKDKATQKEFNQTIAKIKQLMEGKSQSEKTVEIIAVSSHTGLGIEELRNNILNSLNLTKL